MKKGIAPMVIVNANPETIVFEIQGWHKLWALKSRLKIPRAHIQKAHADPAALKGWWHGWRCPGTQIPGLITAGTFIKKGRRVFWDVSNPSNAIIVELQDEAYDKLIIEVGNPARVIHDIMGVPRRE
jgi:hypothetical protein